MGVPSSISRRLIPTAYDSSVYAAHCLEPNPQDEAAPIRLSLQYLSTPLLSTNQSQIPYKYLLKSRNSC